MSIADIAAALAPELTVAPSAATTTAAGAVALLDAVGVAVSDGDWVADPVAEGGADVADGLRAGWLVHAAKTINERAAIARRAKKLMKALPTKKTKASNRDSRPATIAQYSRTG